MLVPLHARDRGATPPVILAVQVTVSPRSTVVGLAWQVTVIGAPVMLRLN